MKYFLSVLLLITSSVLHAQQTTYDIASYNELKGWKKEVKQNSRVLYSKTDSKTGGWCQIAIYHSIPSKGGIDADFSSEWKELVVKNFPNVQGPTGDSTVDVNCWKVKAAMGSFTFNKAPGLAMLTVYSGFSTCISVMSNTNKQEYLSEMSVLINGLTLKVPTNSNTTTTTNANNISGISVQSGSPVGDGYKFTTTNWDDGWTSTLQTNWVEVTKGDVKVLIHFNGIPGEQYESSFMATNKKAWDNVIVPRYTNLTNYEYLNGNMSYIPEYFMAGNLVNKSGKPVFVVLFRSGGRESSWLEFIFPNRKRFTEVFGIDKYDGYTSWKALSKMSNYNKFAVALSDLKGTWTNSFTGMTQYVNVYTGANAGATASSSAQEYVFDGAGNYNWVINAASGMVGNMKFQNAKSAGKATMPSNWQIHLSNIENRPRDYQISFSAVKGARVLWIDGNAFVRM